jgi:hypothetical protein
MPRAFYCPAVRHRLIVLPWLRRPAQRLIMADWLAITIGPLILAWRPLDQVELAHELAHVAQWRRHGLRFIPRYLRASSRAANAGRDRYRDNVFEVRARAAAEAARRQGAAGRSER